MHLQNLTVMSISRTSFLSALLLGLITGCGGSRTVGPDESSRSLALCVMRWELVGPVPTKDPDYTTLETSVIRKIQGIRGFTESDGFHGDGTDWYELELSPNFANDLRAALSQSTTVKTTTSFPSDSSAPSWWPTTWPRGAKCYTKDLEYLVLPDTGTRAWYMRVRT